MENYKRSYLLNQNSEGFDLEATFLVFKTTK